MVDAAREYDDAHGGPERAYAAATAIDALLDERLGTDRRVLDLAAGPGSIAALLVGHVVTLDLSPALAAAAGTRLPGRVVRADAGTELPVRDAAVDAVVTVWWLHMAADPARVVAEVTRVLRPGGVFVTTVDKLAVDEQTRGTLSDRSWRGDATAPLVAVARAHGLDLVGARAFAGHGHPKPVADAAYPLLAFS